MKGDSQPVYTQRVDVKNSTVVPILALAGLFVVLGLAAPRLSPIASRNGARSMTHNATGVAGGVKDRWRTFTTKSRLNGLKQTVKEQTRQRGTPPRKMEDIAGSNTSKDAWGRRIRYVCPTENSSGYLISYGPNGKRGGKDDVIVKISLKDMQ